MEGIFTPLIVTHAYSFATSRSNSPRRTAFTTTGMLPYRLISKLINRTASADGLMPVHFRRRVARLVSYYALFKGMAASKPTS